MNSESARKSPQELKNQARQALREAEKIVPCVAVMDSNWAGLINSLKFQLQMLEDMKTQMNGLVTTKTLTDLMVSQIKLLQEHANGTVEMMETYQEWMEDAAAKQTEQMAKASSEMQLQAGKISEQFSEKLSEVTQQQKRYTRKLFWISLIPALITLLLEWNPCIFSQMFPG